MDALLRARGITKKFPGVIALDQVDFELKAGEIHALCGENGAGKSTFIKILSGIYSHGSFGGSFELDGRDACFSSSAAAADEGVAAAFQELSLAGELSVAENLFLGDEPRRGLLLDKEAMTSQAQTLLSSVGLKIDPAARVDSLGMGARQMVEILKALRKNPRVLILDEPTAALSGTEVEILFERLRVLRAQGVSILYVSHRLEEIFKISDRITVFRDGAVAANFETKDASPELLIRSMVGREISGFKRREASRSGELVLSVEELSAFERREGKSLEGISFELCAGEILGIGGLMGSGRSELLMHLFGVWGARRSGHVVFGGRPLPSGSPRASLAAGLAFVPEDRRRGGLFLERSVEFNLSISALQDLTRGGLIDRERERSGAGVLAERLRVKAPDLDASVATLSGGNQQKTVLGKSVWRTPKVLLLDEPTRGVDVGAKQDIYSLIDGFTAQGMAVLLVSSELPELMALSDRVMILREGRSMGIFPSGTSAEELLAAAFGQGRGAAA